MRYPKWSASVFRRFSKEKCELRHLRVCVCSCVAGVAVSRPSAGDGVLSFASQCICHLIFNQQSEWIGQWLPPILGEAEEDVTKVD